MACRLGKAPHFLVLENEAHAMKRGADIFAWLDGWSLGAEAHHLTHPEPSGAAAAQLMVSAVHHAGLELCDVGYVNAHGTGTIPNDSMEANAVRIAFGNEVDQVHVSTAKGQLGHTLGASGAIEAAITVLALCEGRLPPTMGLTTPAEDTKLNHITGAAISANCRHALSSSFGFGGLGAVLAFSHVDTSNRIPSGLAKTLVITGMSNRVATAIPNLPETVEVPPAIPEGSEQVSTQFSDPLSELDPDRSRRFDRATALVCIGVKQALAGSGLDVAHVGMMVGNALGNVERLRGYLLRLSAKGLRGIPPAEFPHLVPSALAGNASIYLGLRGPVTTLSDEGLCNDIALDLACGCLQLGLAEALVAGVVESRDAGVNYIADPFGAHSGSAPNRSDVSNWFLLQTQDLAQARGQVVLARIVDSWIGQGPWCQYFIEHEAPTHRSSLQILCSGVDAQAFDRIAELKRWRNAARFDQIGIGQSISGQSGAALATAVRLISHGVADEVVLISRSHSHSSIVRLERPDR